MPLVLCERTASGDWQLYCEKCLTSLDIVGSKVLADIRVDYLPVLCLDCDGGADEVPGFLLSDTFPYVLVFDGMRVLVDPFGKLRHFSGRIENFRDELKRAFRHKSTKKPPKTPDGNPGEPRGLLVEVARHLLEGK